MKNVIIMPHQEPIGWHNGEIIGQKANENNIERCVKVCKKCGQFCQGVRRCKHVCVDG